MLWLLKKVGNIAQYKGLEALHRGSEERGRNGRNLYSDDDHKAVDSSKPGPQSISHTVTGLPYSDGRETRRPGLPARQVSLFQLLEELSAGSLQLTALSGIASPKVTHQRQMEAAG